MMKIPPPITLPDSTQQIPQLVLISIIFKNSRVVQPFY